MAGVAFGHKADFATDGASSSKITLGAVRPQKHKRRSRHGGTLVLRYRKVLRRVEASDLFVGYTGTLCYSTANCVDCRMIASIKNWVV